MGQYNQSLYIPSAYNNDFFDKDSLYENSDHENNNNNESKKEKINSKNSLNFKNYSDYLKIIEKFEEIFEKKLPKDQKIIFNNKKNLLYIINNSYFKNLNHKKFSMHQLFNNAINLYNRIEFVYGRTDNYPKEELSKISYPLIAQYLSQNSKNEDELKNTEVSNKIIKRINYLTEEFPLKLNDIKDLIMKKCCFVYGYDLEMNLNIYINQEALNENKIHFNRILIFIIFIQEHILSVLIKNHFYFDKKINVILNCDKKEPNTDLLMFLIIYLDNYCPFILKALHVINYDFEKLKLNFSFKENIKNYELSKLLFFHTNKEKVLMKYIKEKMIPKNFGGIAEIRDISFRENINDDEDYNNFLVGFAQYFIDSIFVKTKKNEESRNKE